MLDEGAWSEHFAIVSGGWSGNKPRAPSLNILNVVFQSGQIVSVSVCLGQGCGRGCFSLRLE